MKRLTFGHQCPLCCQLFRYRIPRRFFMRFIPGSRHYLCDYCGYTSLTFFKRVSIRLDRLSIRKIKSIVKVAKARAE
jgi:hypothetical protein